MQINLTHKTNRSVPKQIRSDPRTTLVLVSAPKSPFLQEGLQETNEELRKAGIGTDVNTEEEEDAEDGEAAGEEINSTEGIVIPIPPEFDAEFEETDANSEE